MVAILAGMVALMWRGGASLWSIAVGTALLIGLMALSAWAAWAVADYIGLSKPAAGILWVLIFGASCLAHYSRNFRDSPPDL